MSIKSIKAGGPAAILATGAVTWIVRDEVHYLLRPSIIETLAGIAAVGGGMVWARNKGKARQAEPVQPAEEIVTSWAPPAALPRVTSTDPIDVAYQRLMDQARHK